jgi:hypothetical protein
MILSLSSSKYKLIRMKLLLLLLWTFDHCNLTLAPGEMEIPLVLSLINCSSGYNELLCISHIYMLKYVRLLGTFHCLHCQNTKFICILLVQLTSICYKLYGFVAERMMICSGGFSFCFILHTTKPPKILHTGCFHRDKSFMNFFLCFTYPHFECCLLP